jgi:IclR family KDG regulon transcriptional repressor
MAVRARSRPRAGEEADRAPDGRVKSADRVMSVLDLVAASGSLSFTAIVERLGLPKSSAHALLRTMEDRGYLTLDPEAKEYRLGSRIWELAQTQHGIEDLRTVMKPLMDELMERTGETVQLARLEGTDAVYLELSESPHPMKLTSRVGIRLPAHASAIGKSLLASLDPDEARRRLAAADLPRLTPETITDPDELLAELERVRRQGYSVDNEEFATGLRCIAMPVRDATGRAIGAISVSMPTPRYSRAAAANARHALAESVTEAAERLGRRPE